MEKTCQEVIGGHLVTMRLVPGTVNSNSLFLLVPFFS